ncbi:MAG: response regulator [Actinobacteria bacterium]|nr:response regulator [Actinomycetota bacterium]
MDGMENGLVLYIDDSGVEREIVRGLLEAEGFEVITTGNADAAAEIARKRLPDLILLDLHMPGRAGSMVVEDLRKVSGLQGVPVVALSASIREEERSEVLALFDGFVKKPVDPDAFPLQVREFIAYGGAGERLETPEKDGDSRTDEEKPSLPETKADLEEALTTLEGIRSVMSHDLRTPLTVIISYAGTVAKEKAGPLNEQQKAMLETVVEHGFKMDAIISDLVRRARETLDKYPG